MVGSGQEIIMALQSNTDFETCAAYSPELRTSDIPNLSLAKVHSLDRRHE